MKGSVGPGCGEGAVWIGHREMKATMRVGYDASLMETCLLSITLSAYFFSVANAT